MKKILLLLLILCLGTSCNEKDIIDISTHSNELGAEMNYNDSIKTEFLEFIKLRSNTQKKNYNSFKSQKRYQMWIAKYNSILVNNYDNYSFKEIKQRKTQL